MQRNKNLLKAHCFKLRDIDTLLRIDGMRINATAFT